MTTTTAAARTTAAPRPAPSPTPPTTPPRAQPKPATAPTAAPAPPRTPPKPRHAREIIASAASFEALTDWLRTRGLGRHRAVTVAGVLRPDLRAVYAGMPKPPTPPAHSDYLALCADLRRARLAPEAAEQCAAVARPDLLARHTQANPADEWATIVAQLAREGVPPTERLKAAKRAHPALHARLTAHPAARTAPNADAAREWQQAIDALARAGVPGPERLRVAARANPELHARLLRTV